MKTPEEMHAEALRLAEEAFDCDFDLTRYSEPSKSERIANAVAAYNEALTGTVIPRQMAIVTEREVTAEDLAELKRRWVACEPLQKGFRLALLDRL